jgi:hypothetical protein
MPLSSSSRSSLLYAPWVRGRLSPPLLLARRMIVLSRKDFFLPPESESAKRKYLYALGT